MSGTVERIWMTDEGSAPMAAVDSVRAMRGGLEGDRYQRGTGYYSGCPASVARGTSVSERTA